MIKNISHITLIVKYLDKTSKMLEYIFDAKEVYSSNNHNLSISNEKFYKLNDLWIVIMQGDSLPSKTYNHIALEISKRDYNIYLERINELELEIKPSRKRIKEEGKSIYFYDYDNHLFELHTGNLLERLRAYEN